jgi:hypothetical protein
VLLLWRIHYQWHNVDWPIYARWFDGWWARASLFVPFIGYLILFNDQIAGSITFHSLTASPHGGWLPLVAKLRLLYFGLIFLGLSNLLYLIRRPDVVTFGSDEPTYVKRALEEFIYRDFASIITQSADFIHVETPPDYNKHRNERADFERLATSREGSSSWPILKANADGFLRSVLRDHYIYHARSRRISLAFCCGMGAAGYLLIALPSMEVFLKVVWATISALLGGHD